MAQSWTRTAAIVAVGSELLGTEKLDTNSLTLSASLELHGVELVEKSVVGDDEGRIAAALRRLIARVDLVIVTGGLGPTRDDCTRAAAAQALGRGITIDPSEVAAIRAKFAAFGREMPEVNQRQAEIIDGAVVLANRKGTAPGQRIDTDGATLFLLPGVPREVGALLRDQLDPWLAAHTDPERDGMLRRVLRVACMAESAVEERLAPVYETFGRDAVAVLARPGDVRVELLLRGAERDREAAMVDAVRRCLGDAIYSEDGARGLEDVVVTALGERAATLSVGESCTGGLVATRLTGVPGVSAVFLGGAVCYANELKESVLGVSQALMIEHGAVSAPVACSMATGACQRFGSTYGLGITGIAGPGGGSEEKPVGTVHIALASPGSASPGSDVVQRCVHFPGDRDQVRQQAAQLALDMLRRALAERTPSAGEGDG